MSVYDLKNRPNQISNSISMLAPKSVEMAAASDESILTRWTYRYHQTRLNTELGCAGALKHGGDLGPLVVTLRSRHSPRNIISPASLIDGIAVSWAVRAKCMSKVRQTHVASILRNQVGNPLN
jgi:hypothetical protein